MIEAHSVTAVRRAESAATAGLPAGALMQRAAAGLAAVVLRELRAQARRGNDGKVYGSKVALLIGPGANGGDALFAGARLAARGVTVTAILASNSAHESALAALRASGGRTIHLSRTAGGAAATAWEVARATVLDADLVVDGLLGIGGRPGLKDAAAQLVSLLDQRIPVIAVDLPSGIDPDTGALAGVHVRADVTVTFGTLKPGLLLPPAAAAAGRIEVLDIGLDHADLGSPTVQRVTSRDAAALWPVPLPSDDKYARGVVGVVAGGGLYTGAAVLATGAAMRAGAGMVRFIGAETVSRAVRDRWPEVVLGAGRVQAWVLGPGVDPDRDDDQARVIGAAFSGERPCVVDAGAIDLLARRLNAGPVNAPLLLTPHAGELARLLNALTDRRKVTRENVEAAPLEHARQGAELTGATVLLKGSLTLVVTPDGGVRSQGGAPAWLATAGAGDVLAGIAGTLLAAGLPPLQAGSLAAWLHGSAATVASRGGPIIAEDVLAAIPATTRRLLRDRCARRGEPATEPRGPAEYRASPGRFW